jgi:hypothetical protein
MIEVIGAGVGRTGTYSLKLALEHLGLGPCHHMEEVLAAADRQVPLWQAAVDGRPDWEATFDGYRSAVDWPTAGFWRELSAHYPDARVILTTRSSESWYESYAATIATLVANRADAPPQMGPWFDMAVAATVRNGIGDKIGRDAIIEAFRAHEAAVKAGVPADRLLVYRVKEGWEPLCRFLGKPVPHEPFPRTNDQTEFWELVRQGMG